MRLSIKFLLSSFIIVLLSSCGSGGNVASQSDENAWSNGKESDSIVVANPSDSNISEANASSDEDFVEINELNNSNVEATPCNNTTTVPKVESECTPIITEVIVEKCSNASNDTVESSKEFAVTAVDVRSIGSATQKYEIDSKE
ncbi:MAG: hypothetical protein U9N49_08340, partial [Campylobacterota bacterium]|nr:hypothetical protein [Campylobacterota bacterium]